MRKITFKQYNSNCFLLYDSDYNFSLVFIILRGIFSVFDFTKLSLFFYMFIPYIYILILMLNFEKIFIKLLKFKILTS